MAITITISTNRQIKTTDGGSIGATAGLTVELVTPASAPDAEIQREIRHHYETITGAMTDQLRELAARRADNPQATRPAPQATPSANGNGHPAANGTGNGEPTTAAPATPATPAPTNPPKPNGARAAKAPVAAPTQTPIQPGAARIALDQELARQFAPRTKPDDDLADDDPLCEEDDTPEDDTPRSGIELLGWARHQPGDAKQELVQIGIHKGFPRLIKDWSPGMVDQALKIYTRTTRN